MPILPLPANPENCAEVVCLGETMAMLSPPDSRPLAEQPSLVLAVGGAESNVACGLAARGVQVGAVEVDPTRPIGVYFKDPGPERTSTHYCRRDSAATGMGPAMARHPLLHTARIVHLFRGRHPPGSQFGAEELAQIRAMAGLTPRSANCRPRIHDLRHILSA